MKFESSNDNIFWFLVLFLVAAIISVFYIVRYQKGKLNNISLLVHVLFLITYFPILEYWSIWTSWSLWPEKFIPNNQSLLAELSEQESFLRSNFIYNSLNIISEYFLFLGIILFLFQVNYRGKRKFLKWIPIINVIVIAKYFIKLFTSKIMKVVTVLWLIFSILWIYYRFLAGPLVLIGVDSFSVISSLLFDDQNNATGDYFNYEYPLLMGYAYFSDLINIITPFLTYVSGILTCILIKMVNKFK